MPANAKGTGGQGSPSSARGTEGHVVGGDGRRREARRKELTKRKGAQHGGTVRGFGAINGSRERGKRRWLAERSSSAVVKVTANATANRS